MSDSHLHRCPHRKGDPPPPPPPQDYGVDYIGLYVDKASRRSVDEIKFPRASLPLR